MPDMPAQSPESDSAPVSPPKEAVRDSRPGQPPPAPMPAGPQAGWMLTDGRFMPMSPPVWPGHQVSPEQLARNRAKSRLQIWAGLLLVAALGSLFTLGTVLYAASLPPERENYTQGIYNSHSSSRTHPELSALALEMRNAVMLSPALWLVVVAEAILIVLGVVAFIKLLKGEPRGTRIGTWRALTGIGWYLPALAWLMFTMHGNVVRFHERADEVYGTQGGTLIAPIGEDSSNPYRSGPEIKDTTIREYFNVVYVTLYCLAAGPTLLFNLLILLALNGKSAKLLAGPALATPGSMRI